MNCFFLPIFPERVQWCEEDGSSSFFCFLSSSNESVIKNGFHVLSTSFVVEKFYPSVWQQDVPHQFWSNCYSTSVSLDNTQECQRFLRIYTTLEPGLVTSLINVLDIHSCSENSCARLSASALNNTGLIESQCSATSVCRSS